MDEWPGRQAEIRGLWCGLFSRGAKQLNQTRLEGKAEQDSILSKTQAMVFPESKDGQTSGPGQKRPIQKQHLPNHLIPKRNILPVNTSVNYEPEDYTETDPLLPNEHFSGSRLGGSEEAKLSHGAEEPPESVYFMVLQILVPFLLAGLGTVAAGLLLDVVQVNAGRMELAKEKWMLIIGNLALKQLQATVLGLLASLMAIVLGWIAEGQMPFNHVILVCSTSLSTTFVASVLQGFIMVGVIIGSKRMGVNPDNVATPMAASFGDLITLAFLACFSRWFFSIIELYSYVLYLIDLFLLCLIPLWIVVSSKHPASRILLRTGWEPIITAMFISSIGGLILDKTMSDPNMAGIILYAPVINGIGGNLVSIQSSRISTNLHLSFSLREVPEDRRSCYNPCSTFFGSGPNRKSAKVLLLMVLPGQLVFLYAIHLIKGAHTMPSPLFTVAFLSASLIQVLSLLCIADCMVHSLWRRGKDPDSYSIPYLTAIGDLLGTALLSLAFLLLWCTGYSV
ncbi:solute carrier family 41 member 2 isoform X2 [Nerophis ophidion]|uniref:solute carrier family 41 member 2 isoform X2 n=1 Tax=Nerophis ophidion TaxID=159077 RepID=UPI002ADFB2AF|nr:solute carrier family 41 member 2 isoform X2 [Nerophis ophidion]